VSNKTKLETRRNL